jgi:hypothetical protein
MSVAVSRKGLATKFLQNMRDQAHKAGYDVDADLRGFKFQMTSGFLSFEELKTSQEELDRLVAINHKVRGL